MVQAGATHKGVAGDRCGGGAARTLMGFPAVGTGATWLASAALVPRWPQNRAEVRDGGHRGCRKWPVAQSLAGPCTTSCEVRKPKRSM